MKIKTIVAGACGSNTYIIENNNDKAIIIDPGDDCRILDRYISENNLSVVAVLLTHGHFDHAGTAKKFQDAGATIYLHSAEAHMLKDSTNLAYICGLKFNSFTADKLLNNNDCLEINGLKIKVFHTAGHTAGSVCYLIDNTLFTGDTLFRLSIGRTDFPTSSVSDMQHSLAMLLSLNEDIVCYPGHEQPTTIKFEKENNKCLT